MIYDWINECTNVLAPSTNQMFEDGKQCSRSSIPKVVPDSWGSASWVPVVSVWILNWQRFLYWLMPSQQWDKQNEWINKTDEINKRDVCTFTVSTVIFSHWFKVHQFAAFEQIFLLMSIIIIMDIWLCLYGHVTLKSQLMNWRSPNIWAIDT